MEAYIVIRRYWKLRGRWKVLQKIKCNARLCIQQGKSMTGKASEIFGDLPWSPLLWLVCDTVWATFVSALQLQQISIWSSTGGNVESILDHLCKKGSSSTWKPFWEKYFLMVTVSDNLLFIDNTTFSATGVDTWYFQIRSCCTSARKKYWHKFQRTNHSSKWCPQTGNYLFKTRDRIGFFLEFLHKA